MKVSDDTVFKLRKVLETVVSPKLKSSFLYRKTHGDHCLFQDEQFIKLFTFTFYRIKDFFQNFPLEAGLPLRAITCNTCHGYM